MRHENPHYFANNASYHDAAGCGRPGRWVIATGGVYSRRMNSRQQLEILSVPLTELCCDPGNVRRHDEKNIAAIKQSLQRFGQQKPIVIDGANIIRAGNGTFQAARELGWTHISAVRTTLDGADAVAYAIADNRTAELAAWDHEALIRQLGALDADLAAAAGFTDKDIAELSDGTPRETDEPTSPLPESYELAVTCRDQADQQELYERLTAEGRTCRVLTL